MPETKDNKDPNQLTFIEHLEELRKRLLASAIAIVLAFIGCYFVSDILLEIIQAPLKEILPPGDSLIGTGVTEAFVVKMYTALLAAVILTCPFWLYQLWLFVSPGLYKKEKNIVIPFVFFTSFFFVGGVVFGYYEVIPAGFKFFIGQFQETGLSAQIKIQEYFSFTARILLAFGICFELPIAAYFLGRIGLISAKGMLKAGRYAILVILIVAALLTPGPDIISQLLLAGPLLALYVLSIGVVALTGKKKTVPAAAPKPEEK